MQLNYNAVVIKTINYSDSSLIVRAYTDTEGLKSFIIKGARNKKKNSVMGLFQPLSAVEIVTSFSKKSNSLQYIKEVKSRFPIKEMHTNPIKLGVVIFIAEILDKVLKEEEENHLLFDFVNNSIHYFDELDKFANFHISFLIELTKYLGFYPLISDENPDSFDLESGNLYNSKDSFEASLDKDSVVSYLLNFLGTKFVGRRDIIMSRKHRIELLELLMEYYKIHINGFTEPKSFEILKNLYID
jgi:DNA repair protein RecO (recombination protein O)